MAHRPEDAGFDTVCTNSVAPAVLLGQALALLLGERFATIAGHHRFCHSVTSPEAGSAWIVTLPDAVRDAVAQAPAERLAEICPPWSQAEEFYGDADPSRLADVLDELSALAGRPRALLPHEALTGRFPGD